MKRIKWIGLAMAALVVATLACGGGGDETPTAVPVEPTQVVVQPTTPPVVSSGEGLDYTLDPNFGEAELASGFVPDPYEVAVVSGGGVDVWSLDLGMSCTGYATSAPDFRLFLSGDSPGLNIFFVPDDESSDTTLIINEPTGSWACNDDYNGWNPMVEFSNPAQGQYDIWVGSYSSDELVAGTLYITELGLEPDDITEGSAGEVDGEGTLDYTLDPNFGEEELETGFLPDPYEVPMASGGNIDVWALDLESGCTGYATSAPDFRFYFTGDSPGLRIFFVPSEAGEDTTLIVNTPDAGWACNDDYDFLSPLVEFDDPAEGQYDVWVGSYMSGEIIPGTLYITELDLSPDDFAGDAGGGGGAVVGEIYAQWATYAEASSEYSSPGWSAMQATGAPNTDGCGDISTAWASDASDGIDWLELTYTFAVIPQEINIYETHSPGYLETVEVVDEDGDYYTVWTWEGPPDDEVTCPRVFSIYIGDIDFPINRVRLSFDQTEGSWNEIDAVELIGEVE
ncbi:MAG: hypothetical protein JXD18_10795 [Anaerolineae bacterium]|nr:hypothetical protein [Anaerolineae bacterium]